MKITSIIKYSKDQVYFYKAEYFRSIFLLNILRRILMLPLMAWLFYQVLRLADISSVTESTISLIFKSPSALLVLGILLVVTLCFIFLEMGYYLLLAQSHQNGEQLQIRGVFKSLGGQIRRILGLQLVFLFFYFILILPLAVFGLRASLIKNLRIPYFIIDELLKKEGGQIFYWLFLIFFLFLAIKLIYTLPFFLGKENLTLWKSARKSWQYTKGKFIKTFITVGAGLLAYWLAVFVLMVAVISPFVFVEFFFSLEMPIMAGITLAILQIILVFAFGFSQAFLAELLVTLSVQKKAERPVKEKKKFFKYGVILVLIVAVMSVGNILVLKEGIYQPPTEIIAHRGYTAKSVENTISSLKDAAKLKADCVELDIQETKDQEVVVFHDSDLTRLGRSPRLISQMTLEEIQEVEIRKGANKDRIPSFEEFIREAKDLDMPLLIEVKIYGHESPEFAKNLVDLLQREGEGEEYFIQSFDEGILDEIKTLDPQIKTGLLVAFNLGGFPKTTADFISIEEFSATNSFLKEAKGRDKDVLVWTVNRDNLIRQYLAVDVKGIITSRPKEALKFRAEYKDSLSGRLIQLFRW